MSSTLSWTLQLVDRISPGAKAAMRALAGVRGQLEDVRRAMGRPMRDPFTGQFTASASTRLGRLAQGVRRLGQSVAASGPALMGLGGMVAGAGLAAGAGAYAFGRSVVDLASFQQSSITSLSATVGRTEAAAAGLSGQAAEAYRTATAMRMFRNAIALANQTPLDTRDAVESMTALANAGFSERAITPLLASAADLGSAFGSQAQQGFIFAIGQIRSKGTAAMEEINQLTETGRVSRESLFAAIAQRMNFRGDTAAINRQVQAAISARRVTADTVIAAAQTAVSQSLNGGGALGGFARAQSQTLVGSLSNLSNAWDNLVLSIGTRSDGLANTPGLRAFRETVDAVTGALDVSTPRGARAMQAVLGLTNALFGSMFGGAGAQGQNVIDRIITAVERATPAIGVLVGGVRSFVEGVGSGFMAAVGPAIELIQQLGTEGAGSGNMLRDVGRAVGYVAGAFVLGVGVIGAAVAGFVRFIDDFVSSPQRAMLNLVSFFTGVPIQLVDGFLGSLRTQWQVLISTVEGLAAQLPVSVRRVLGIHSPSRVMMQIGAHTVAGMEEGILGGQGDVERAMSMIVSPRAGRDGGGTGRGAAPISVQVVVNTDARDPEGVGEAVAARLETLFADLFERAALGVG